MASALERLTTNVEMTRQLLEERNRLIVNARREGNTWRSMSLATGLTDQALLNAARAANGGELPKPQYAKVEED